MKIKFLFESNDGIWLLIPTPFIEVGGDFDIGLAFLHWNIRIRFIRRR